MKKGGGHGNLIGLRGQVYKQGSQGPQGATGATGATATPV